MKWVYLSHIHENTPSENELIAKFCASQFKVKHIHGLDTRKSTDIFCGIQPVNTASKILCIVWEPLRAMLSVKLKYTSTQDSLMSLLTVISNLYTPLKFQSFCKRDTLTLNTLSIASEILCNLDWLVSNARHIKERGSANRSLRHLLFSSLFPNLLCLDISINS